MRSACWTSRASWRVRCARCCSATRAPTLSRSRTPRAGTTREVRRDKAARARPRPRARRRRSLGPALCRRRERLLSLLQPQQTKVGRRRRRRAILQENATRSRVRCVHTRTSQCCAELSERRGAGTVAENGGALRRGGALARASRNATRSRSITACLRTSHACDQVENFLPGAPRCRRSGRCSVLASLTTGTLQASLSHTVWATATSAKPTRASSTHQYRHMVGARAPGPSALQCADVAFPCRLDRAVGRAALVRHGDRGW
jgi:hypothetical protein